PQGDAETQTPKNGDDSSESTAQKVVRAIMSARSGAAMAYSHESGGASSGKSSFSVVRSLKAAGPHVSRNERLEPLTERATCPPVSAETTREKYCHSTATAPGECTSAGSRMQA